MCETAAQAGWRVSRYNLAAPIPGTDKVAIANLFRGTCGAYTPIELYLLDELESLDANHPMLKRFRERGLIVNFDEREALDTMGRLNSRQQSVGLTLCPTMACNFDCPYCFENHRGGKMSPKTQDDVIALTEKMMDAAGAKRLNITWFGGEPLLAVDVIEALSRRLISLCENRGVEYKASVITNGYLLTQDIADMLGRYHVESAQITLDGINEAHDRTRHLAGGGPTFERIAENLRGCRLPFRVVIRHNVHAGNRDQIDALRAFAKQVSEESGNRIGYDIALITGNDASDARTESVKLLCDADACEIGLARAAYHFAPGREQYCQAHTLFQLGIDEKGNLQKCWEDMDKPEHSFGAADRWDPADPIATADHPDNLTRYFNTSLPTGDPECRECVWLPLCAGGCPNKRLYYHRQCLPFRDEKEKYVLALYDRIGKEKGE